MFYSNKEYNFQVQELVDQGMSLTEAGAIVEQRMAQDEVEYNEWVVEQFNQTQKEMA